MHIPELKKHFDDYRKKGIAVVHSRRKAIHAYNSSHPNDKLPDNVWDSIGGEEGELAQNADSTNAEIASIRKDNAELSEALKGAAQRIRDLQAQIEVKDQTIDYQEKINTELNSELESLAKGESETPEPIEEGAGNATEPPNETGNTVPTE